MGLLPELRRARYHERVLATAPGNLIRYWPMWEQSGTKGYNLAPVTYGPDGTYNAPILGLIGSGDGFSAPLFDNVDDLFNIYSAALNAALNWQEVTIALWVKFSSSAFWTDGVFHTFLRVAADANNDIRIRKSSTNNTLSWLYTAGSTAKQVTFGGQSSMNFMHLALTASKAADAMMAYLNGVQVGATQTGLGTFTGALNSAACVISSTGAGATPASGSVAHAAIWNVALPAAAIANLAIIQ